MLLQLSYTCLGSIYSYYSNSKQAYLPTLTLEVIEPNPKQTKPACSTNNLDNLKAETNTTTLNVPNIDTIIGKGTKLNTDIKMSKGPKIAAGSNMLTLINNKKDISASIPNAG